MQYMVEETTYNGEHVRFHAVFVEPSDARSYCNMLRCQDDGPDKYIVVETSNKIPA